MARVKFEVTWFSPEGRFRKGIHEVPERLLPLLPKSGVKVLDKAEIKAAEAVEETPVTLRDMDELRVADNHFLAALEKAELQYKENEEVRAEATVVKRGRGRPRKNP